MSENIDPWLYPGCICKLFGNKDRVIAIFDHYEDKKILFKNQSWEKWFEIDLKNPKGCYYKVIGTPWDFAPKDAILIYIYNDKTFEFVDSDQFVIASSGIILWHSCPDYLKGKTWTRPEWAKEKT